MAADSTALLPGTLDMLILKAVSLGELHGYGVLLRIQHITRGALTIEQGAVYPALHRLVRQQLLETHWGTSDNNRRAKYYSLTRLGRKQLEREQEDWLRIVDVMGRLLRAEGNQS